MSHFFEAFYLIDGSFLLPFQWFHATLL